MKAVGWFLLGLLLAGGTAVAWTWSRCDDAFPAGPANVVMLGEDGGAGRHWGVWYDEAGRWRLFALYDDGHRGCEVDRGPWFGVLVPEAKGTAL